MGAEHSVTVDGEAVQFEGPVPATPRACLELMASALEANQRVLTGFVIDGRTVEEAPEALENASWRTIAATSEDASVQRQEETREVASRLQAEADRAHQLGARCLFTPWSDCIEAVGNHVAATGALFDLLVPANSGEASSFSQVLHKLQAVLLELVEAVERVDIALVSDCLAEALPGALREARDEWEAHRAETATLS